ncbi:MAG: L-threonylcarbamoyladenylate synthase [Syntrophomonadaceae bacterium]|nr:L-threonylcarbamoyladenylate synthase [Syntrophomonadaceae bacterium]
MYKTCYFKVDALNPQPDIIEAAARYIKAGQLVAFPTETVYGLGADAFQPWAVEKIFLAKGRPPQNALLVHVSNLKQVQLLVGDVPGIARKLMDHFWPGPLSLILPARPAVPDIVRGGHPSVGLRMPSHPVALALIEATGPIAAPSANLYGRPSPTNALHVRQDLDGKIDAVLDAGDTGAGLESTILDMTTASFKILRSGGVNIEALEEFLGTKLEIVQAGQPACYKTGVQVIISDDEDDYNLKLQDLLAQGRSVGTVHINDDSAHKIDGVKYIFALSLSGSGKSLYAILREAEQIGLETLLIAPFDHDQAGKALVDRLRRAAFR